MTTDYRTKIRSQIAPMHPTPTYLTEWAGRQTSEQIYENLATYASNIMKLYGVLPHHIPDCIQNGFVALLEQLACEPYFLACMTRRQAVYFILARCKISSLRHRENQCDSFEVLVDDTRHDTADEHTITGWEYHREERWAAWATDIDLRLDIERVMGKLAEKYMDSPKHLIALYQVTTSVKRCDAAKLAGVTHWNWLKTYVEPVLKDVRYEFAQVFIENHTYTPLQEKKLAENRNKGQFISPNQAWREQYQRGRTEPAETLLEQYRHTPCIAGAIRAQIEGKTYRQAALDMGRNPNSFPKHMKRAARMLSAAYA